MDRTTANRNIRLALILALFSLFMFLSSFVVAEIVIHG
jgi:hypothetical protein